MAIPSPEILFPKASPAHFLGILHVCILCPHACNACKICSTISYIQSTPILCIAPILPLPALSRELDITHGHSSPRTAKGGARGPGAAKPQWRGESIRPTTYSPLCTCLESISWPPLLPPLFSCPDTLSPTGILQQGTSMTTAVPRGLQLASFS